jgi:small subunit ribosomal protein S2
LVNNQNKNNNMSKTENLPTFSIKQLLEAGVHFGHNTMRRNPKMARYVYANRNNISIIDLSQTANMLHKAMSVAKEIAKNNGRILFIATKRQASDVVAAEATRCGQYYVNQRWLGGMLTNWKTVSQSIKTLKKIEEQLSDAELGFNKKEKLVLERKRQKLESALGGIKNIGGYPDLIFVIDIYKEQLAVAEAKKLGVPIMAVVDTNTNPDPITYQIPGNDDSVKAIKLYCRLISDSIIAGIRENMAVSGIDIAKFEDGQLPDIAKMKAALEDVKAEKKPSGEHKRNDRFDDKKGFKGKMNARHDSKSKEGAGASNFKKPYSGDKKLPESKPAEQDLAKNTEESKDSKKPAVKKPAAAKPAAKKPQKAKK